MTVPTTPMTDGLASLTLKSSRRLPGTEVVSQSRLHAAHPATQLLAQRERLTETLVKLAETCAVLPAPTTPTEIARTARELLSVPVTYLDRAIVHGLLGYPELAAGDCWRAVGGVESVEGWSEEVGGILELNDDDDDEDGYDEGEDLHSEGCACSSSEDESHLSDGSDSNTTDDEVGEEEGEEEEEEEEEDTASWLLEALHAEILALPTLPVGFGKRLGDLTSTDALNIVALAGYTHYLSLTGSAKETAIYTRRLEAIYSNHDLISPTPCRRTCATSMETGTAAREIYPWNTYEPDRVSPTLLKEINKVMAAACVPDSEKPWIEVRATQLPMIGGKDGETVTQLGVFALRDIPASQVYLKEFSPLIAATTRSGAEVGRGGERCEYCTGAIKDGEGITCGECVEAAEEDEDVSIGTFCSETCYEKGMENGGHEAVCSRPWGWLHRAVWSGEKEKENRDALVYSLLLLKAFSLALAREEHPLQMPWTHYLYGAGEKVDSISESFLNHSSRHTFIPALAIELPQRILHTMGVPIQPLPVATLPSLSALSPEQFPEPNQLGGDYITLCKKAITHFDTSTATIPLLHKMQGVASLARETDKSLFPHREVRRAHVHPLYSLANHSCAPRNYWNVVSGEMRFQALGEAEKSWLADSGVRKTDGDGDAAGWQGIRAGDEILNSYVDPRLDVQQRRANMWGVMGGNCLCERCVVEADEA